MRQDRRSEQGVIGFPCRLQRADERRVGVVGLAQVEELDPPGQQQGLGQGRGKDRVADPRRLAEQVNAQAGVLDDRRVQVRGLNIGVEAPVGGCDGRVVACHGGRLDDARGPLPAEALSDRCAGLAADAGRQRQARVRRPIPPMVA